MYLIDKKECDNHIVFRNFVNFFLGSISKPILDIFWWNKFIDNVKLFFSFGYKKVVLAIEIREKELNSAIANLKSGEKDKANENIESAIKMLILFAQR